MAKNYTVVQVTDLSCAVNGTKDNIGNKCGEGHNCLPCKQIGDVDSARVRGNRICRKDDQKHAKIRFLQLT